MLTFYENNRVRGGVVDLCNGSLRAAGYDNYYWSPTIYPNTTNAYNLGSNRTYVYPSAHNYQFLGFSVRGGIVYLGTGSVRFAGYGNNYWSSTTYSNATNAYDFPFNNSYIHPSNHSSRFHGFSINQHCTRRIR